MGNKNSASQYQIEKIRIMHTTSHKNHSNNNNNNYYNNNNNNNILISNTQLKYLFLQQNENSLNDRNLKHNGTSISTLNNYPSQDLPYPPFENCNINHSNSSSSSSSPILDSPEWDSSSSTLNNLKNFPSSNNMDSTNLQSTSTLITSYEKSLPPTPPTSSDDNSGQVGDHFPTIGHITNTFIVDEPDDISDTTIRTSNPPSLFPREHDNNSDETATLNPSLLFNSNEFYSLPEVHVISLLQRDDIEISEIEIWNQLIAWGIKNTFQISNKNFLEWNDQDFDALKNTLKHCIDWIRFYQIKPQEFAEYVWPYKKILPQSIIGNFLREQITGHAPIMETNINPPRIPSSDIDSIIMTGRHATIISNWTLRETFCGKCLFNFNLIYRASTDGLSSKIFHEKCDDKGPTILVIKLSNSKEIIGVYNPLPYQKSKITLKRRSLMYNNNNQSKRKSNSYDPYINVKEAKKDTFLFSFQTRYYPEESAIISRIIPSYSSEAITKNSNNNLCFGLGPDLRINLDNDEKFGEVLPYSFQNPILNFDGRFEFEEIEVFQVLRKVEYREGRYY
ncbi:unnamed protein product [Rhizophagus irregularis]|uniref:TLDc domain-containing protein n=1 Tax=Rhizophagus irregularis TaxID=588596 RepID=A0A2N1MXX3_9GLOM|nr:hypothetical protein RhiirC2_30170 [Rhizophagus irregularis]CAB4381488.1 unnamed protein product [Rhizophagus irregularis]CAB5333054.1 unnamed protein product [Rhizophagus irregularis]